MKPVALSPSYYVRCGLTALSLCLAAALVNPSFAQDNTAGSAGSRGTGVATGTVNKGAAATDRRRAPSTPDAAATTVVASHPVVYGLLEILTKDSPITAVRATPGNLPPSRHYSYLSGRGAKAFDRVVRKADAVVHLRSIWPDDPLYSMARLHNIRVVGIDAANPVDHRLPGIAADTHADTAAAYPWLNPVNMGRMADIIASDLQRLEPKAHDVLEKNLADLKQRLVRLNAQVESDLLDAASLTVVVLSPRVNTLATAFNLDIVPVQENGDWNEKSLAGLSKTITDNEVKVVLLHEAAAPDVSAAITAAGAKAVVVETDGDDPVSALEGAGKSIVQAMAAESGA